MDTNSRKITAVMTTEQLIELKKQIRQYRKIWKNLNVQNHQNAVSLYKPSHQNRERSRKNNVTNVVPIKHPLTIHNGQNSIHHSTPYGYRQYSRNHYINPSYLQNPTNYSYAPSYGYIAVSSIMSPYCYNTAMLSQIPACDVNRKSSKLISHTNIITAAATAPSSSAVFHAINRQTLSATDHYYKPLKINLPKTTTSGGSAYISSVRVDREVSSHEAIKEELLIQDLVEYDQSGEIYNDLIIDLGDNSGIEKSEPQPETNYCPVVVHLSDGDDNDPASTPSQSRTTDDYAKLNKCLDELNKLPSINFFMERNLQSIQYEATTQQNSYCVRQTQQSKLKIPSEKLLIDNNGQLKQDDKFQKVYLPPKGINSRRELDTLDDENGILFGSSIGEGKVKMIRKRNSMNEEDKNCHPLCWCGKRAEFLCPCRSTVYCCEPCQSTKWSFHKSNCLMKRSYTNKIYSTLTNSLDCN